MHSAAAVLAIFCLCISTVVNGIGIIHSGKQEISLLQQVSHEGTEVGCLVGATTILSAYSGEFVEQGSLYRNVKTASYICKVGEVETGGYYWKLTTHSTDCEGGDELDRSELSGIERSPWDRKTIWKSGSAYVKGECNVCVQSETALNNELDGEYAAIGKYGSRVAYLRIDGKKQIQWSDFDFRFYIQNNMDCTTSAGHTASSAPNSPETPQESTWTKLTVFAKPEEGCPASGAIMLEKSNNVEKRTGNSMNTRIATVNHNMVEDDSKICIKSTTSNGLSFAGEFNNVGDGKYYNSKAFVYLCKTARGTSDKKWFITSNNECYSSNVVDFCTSNCDVEYPWQIGSTNLKSEYHKGSCEICVQDTQSAKGDGKYVMSSGLYNNQNTYRMCPGNDESIHLVQANFFNQYEVVLESNANDILATSKVYSSNGNGDILPYAIEWISGASVFKGGNCVSATNPPTNPETSPPTNPETSPPTDPPTRVEGTDSPVVATSAPTSGSAQLSLESPIILVVWMAVTVMSLFQYLV